MIIGVDHVIIAVDELAKAMEAWRRLGFQVLQGGEHPQFGTHNALVPLADGFYFELMAIKDPTLIDRFPVTTRLREVLSNENRFLGFALESDDVSGDVNASRERGLAIQKAPPGERVRPGGQVVRWRTAHPEDQALPFLIQDQTQRGIRVPAPTQGIGQNVRVECVEVTSHDPRSLCQNYTKLLGEESSDERFPLRRGTIGVALLRMPDEINTVVLSAVTLPSVARLWDTQRIPFREESLPRYGTVLLPTDMAGVRLVVTKE